MSETKLNRQLDRVKRVGSGQCKIGILDPSIDSGNQGDHIIREAVGAILPGIAPEGSLVRRFPTQRPLTAQEREEARACEKFVLAGTNILSSNIITYRQWKVRPRDRGVFSANVLLMGVGWWQYQSPPTWLTKKFLHHVLAPVDHSVRDSYTVQQLATAGIASVNTACPTMWSLDRNPERSRTLGDKAVVTLTDYNRNPELDRRLLAEVRKHYRHVVLWPQGSRDERYIRRLDPEADLLPRTLRALNEAIDSGCDYIGTRLHAGIRALSIGGRATIIAVDNRAQEIARDTGIPVISRQLDEEGIALAFGDREIAIHLPRGAIEAWKTTARTWLAAGS